VGKIKVALIMGRTAKDGTGSVTHQDEIGDVDREFFALDEWVCNAQAGIMAAFIGRLNGFFAGAQLAAFLDEGRRLGVLLREFLG
jgi:hypothetical protein